MQRPTSAATGGGAVHSIICGHFRDRHTKALIARDGISKIMEYQSAMEDTYASAGPDRRTWWSGRRRRYNVSLIVAAPISAASQIAVWGLFEERLPC
jgi:hypothetical protein